MMISEDAKCDDWVKSCWDEVEVEEVTGSHGITPVLGRLVQSDINYIR